ncbi:hypothetical protein GCM10011415_06810 [Salipiger pallidus]|uniref:Sulfotransferase family protein n=1 Tax=Salipiger pallidus TaxID=1775170 RepID=A0A8J2ZHE5_9RHOB|nr:sulfotransferase [Salipiger pallidus]GGG63043.1 hypothetical protein GCM10011415_06810 [Salipiger pallidus]
MAYKGLSIAKRLIQSALRPLGYKFVQAEAYEARMGALPRTNTGFSKLLCIGFNKTATTTLKQVLCDRGGGCPSSWNRKRSSNWCRTTAPTPAGVTSAMISTPSRTCRFHKARFMWPAMRRSPGARFILTVRDPEAWLDSYIHFCRGQFGLEDVQRSNQAVFADLLLYLRKGYVHEVFLRLLWKIRRASR